MNLLANHGLATLQLNKSTNWQHIYISLRGGTRSKGMKIQKLDTITTLAGGRKGQRCGGKFLRGVWWFLHWLPPPQSHPALLGKWISRTGVADALPVSAGWGRSCGMCQGAAGVAWAVTSAGASMGTAGTWPQCSAAPSIPVFPFFKGNSRALPKGKVPFHPFGGWSTWLTPAETEDLLALHRILPPFFLPLEVPQLSIFLIDILCI